MLRAFFYGHRSLVITVNVGNRMTLHYEMVAAMSRPSEHCHFPSGQFSSGATGCCASIDP
jgi:hypothetical protein